MGSEELNIFDYSQDVATCCYGDMLWDHERNEKFKLALKSAITKRKQLQKSTHVLDIGTGTGLLSMIAVQNGADSVVACEMFSPVARCAQRIIKQNGFDGKIKVINKHSTELTVGLTGDLPIKADILVSEVFDTELIGEGALKTFNHAHANLLQPDAIVIPSMGTIYCQLISSESLERWNTLMDWKDNGEEIVKVPEFIKKCSGAPALFDIQLSQMPAHQFSVLTEPLTMFRFDFMRTKLLPVNEQCAVSRIINSSSKAHAVFMWWDLIMDDVGEINLSCAPVWAHYLGKKKGPPGNPALHIPWRDHWMQAIYFLKHPVSGESEWKCNLRGWHDEFSFWFTACTCQDECRCSKLSERSPICQCGLHLIAGRTRLAALNDPERRIVYFNVVKQLVTKSKIFVIFGDFTLLGCLLAHLGAEQIHLLVEDNSIWTERVYRSFQEFNKSKICIHTSMESISSHLKIFNFDDLCILGEPFFTTSVLPWDNLRFLTLKNSLLLSLNIIEKSRVIVSPESATIMAVCVAFDDLWKINRPLVACQGFKMNLFDEILREAKTVSQNCPEPQPLWEYPCKALSTPVNLITVNFCELYQEEFVTKTADLHTFTGQEEVNAIVLWMEYNINADLKVSTGPVTRTQIGEYITWNQFEKQGVFIFETPRREPRFTHLSCHTQFNTKTSECSMTFSDSKNPVG